MTETIIISILSFIGLIALIFFKPSVIVKGRSLNIYWLAPLIGAILLVVFGVLNINAIASGLTADAGMNPIKILVLLISMTVISIYLDSAGFFGYVAGRVLNFANGSQTLLFFCLYAIVSVLTVFTSNDIIVLTFTPFICYFAKNTKIDPLPYLICEFIAANTWSMALFIGNPTNIYIASTAGIDFFDYTRVMLLPTVLSGVFSIAMVFVLFRKRLKKKAVMHGGASSAIENKAQVFAGIIHLALCIVLMSVSHYINLPMWLIALSASVSLMLFAVIHSLFSGTGFGIIKATLARVPWDVVPFIISMFTIVLAYEKCGITEWLTALFSKINPVVSFGVASYLSANVINNIPMSVLFSSIAAGVGQPAVYASIIGSNTGAFLTPIGAIAGIMWMSLLKLHRVKLSYVEFTKYGAVISVPALLAALVGLYIVL